MQPVINLLLASAVVAAQQLSSNLCQHGCQVISSRSHRKINTNGTYDTPWPWQSFKSSPITPPYMNITGHGHSLDPNHLFITPADSSGLGAKASYPLIVTNDGDLVFAHNVSGTTDFRVQNHNGKPHLTFWSGYNTMGVNIGHGYGNVTFLDEGYESFVLKPDLPITALVPTPDGIVDIHEHQITKSGKTMMITTYNNSRADLSGFGVRNGWIVTSLVAEIDIATGKPLFVWNPLDHGVSLKQSKAPLKTDDAGNGTKAAPWDWCHINSATKVGDNYLINSRHLWTVWLVNGRDGSIIWELEGSNGGDFGQLPEGGTFKWEHYARAHNVSNNQVTISLFNNDNNTALKAGSGQSTGIVLELDLPPNKKRSPRLLRNLLVPGEPLSAGSQGSYVPELSNGNALMGYGQIPVVREYGSLTSGNNQELLREWRFGKDSDVQDYRAFKMPWSATPKGWGPNLVVEKGKKGESQGYVSWNGATDISDWDVLAGSSAGKLSYIGRAKKHGFETTFELGSEHKCVQVIAISNGKQVRRSNVAC